ncbi:hypothetical protein CRM22_001566 [Opisthorchis felineus]|uniref:Uncharacterized protein n=1 Tax=Opisthorchis felineus TaxID=147828 RepID=A0A4S2MA99_OPIFE|nr:hypothetical protein CRM22_001566 [Opisthorchis felineus]
MAKANRTSKVVRLNQHGTATSVHDTDPEDVEEEVTRCYLKCVKSTVKQKDGEKADKSKISRKLRKFYDDKANAVEAILFHRDDMVMQERVNSQIRKMLSKIRVLKEPEFMSFLDPNSATARAFALNFSRNEVRQALLQIMNSAIGQEEAVHDKDGKEGEQVTT